MTGTAVAAKKLDVRIGEVVEIDGRRYDVVSDEEDGARWSRRSLWALKLRERYRARPVTKEEFEELLGTYPQTARADRCRQQEAADGWTCGPV